MYTKLITISKWVVGVILVIVGTLALFIPLLPFEWVIILLGLGLLGVPPSMVKKYLNAIKNWMKNIL